MVTPRASVSPQLTCGRIFLATCIQPIPAYRDLSTLPDGDIVRLLVAGTLSPTVHTSYYSTAAPPQYLTPSITAALLPLYMTPFGLCPVLSPPRIPPDVRDARNTAPMLDGF